MRFHQLGGLSKENQGSVKFKLALHAEGKTASSWGDAFVDGCIR